MNRTAFSVPLWALVCDIEVIDLTIEEEDPWLSDIGTHEESFVPSSPLLTVATDESLDIAAEFKMVKECHD